MTDSTQSAGPADKGLKILIIHAHGCPPDDGAIRKLLEKAGLSGASIVFATPADVENGSVDPKEFDHVFALLDDDLATDDQLEGGMLGVAQCGMSVTGIWGDGMASEDMHPALQKFGGQQIPWDAEKLLQALDTPAPKTFQSTSGGAAARHDSTHNKC